MRVNIWIPPDRLVPLYPLSDSTLATCQLLAQLLQTKITSLSQLISDSLFWSSHMLMSFDHLILISENSDGSLTSIISSLSSSLRYLSLNCITLNSLYIVILL